LSADRSVVSSLSADRGDVVDPAGSYGFIPMFREPTFERVKKMDYSIWDCWPLLGLIVVVATCEWVIRKKAGLA